LVALCVLAFAYPSAAFPLTRLVRVRAHGAELYPEQDAMRSSGLGAAPSGSGNAYFTRVP